MRGIKNQDEEVPEANGVNETQLSECRVVPEANAVNETELRKRRDPEACVCDRWV